jgi:thymidylate synthase (FAD)
MNTLELSDDKTYRSVLNHGFVRLVDHMGSDLSVVRAARVSYDADWRSGEDEGKDSKLIRYLLLNQHTSPFESVVFTFEIKVPIFILRQWGRHRTQGYNDGAGIGYEKYWAYNEVSARYTELPDEFYIPDPSMIGRQSKDNKQARDIDALNDAELLSRREAQCILLREQCQRSYELYRFLLDDGWPRELARTALHVNFYTRLFATVNLHNLLLWLNLRLHPHAQYEIRRPAIAVLELVTNIVPVTIRHWTAIRHAMEKAKNDAIALLPKS